jgi:thiamine-monophosphate kinase
VGDLGHILEASQAGATIELSAIPRSSGLDRRLASNERDVALECLLAGGDDYELCFTAPANAAATLRDISAGIGVALTCIGSIDARPGLTVLDENRRQLSPPKAFDHFR